MQSKFSRALNPFVCRARPITRLSPDQARYDAEWRRLRRREAASLARLEAAAADAAAACPDGRARQLAPRRQGGGPRRGPPQRRLATTFDPEVLGPAPGGLAPVTSLDRLFAQAAGAAQLLRSACEAWAAASGGEVAGEAPDAAETGKGGGDPGAPPPWALPALGLKPARRAVAKAAFCYQGDPSRLLDICRARIVYGGVAGLLRGLEAVLAGGCAGGGADHRVRVVRVKNGLRAGNDGSLTAGFRVRLKGRGCGAEIMDRHTRCFPNPPHDSRRSLSLPLSMSLPDNQQQSVAKRCEHSPYAQAH